MGLQLWRQLLSNTTRTLQIRFFRMYETIAVEALDL